MPAQTSETSETGTNDRWDLLTRPFDDRDVYLTIQAVTRDGSRGLVFPRLDARAVMERLDEVAGPGNWEDRYDTWGGAHDRVYVKCRLTVDGVTKEDVGEGRDYKAAVSDALKRAAVKFGVGRYLYHTPEVWVDLDENGRIRDPQAARARLFGNPYPRSRDRGRPVVGRVFRERELRRSG